MLICMIQRLVSTILTMKITDFNIKKKKSLFTEMKFTPNGKGKRSQILKLILLRKPVK